MTEPTAPQTPSPSKTAGVKPTWASRLAPLREWLPNKTQAATVAIGLLTISNVACLVMLNRNAPPEVMTVGVREMTQGYMSSIALANITPEEAGVRMDLFMSVTQDTLQRAGRDKNVLLLARECVLAGQTADVTAEVGEAVKAAMARAGAGRLTPTATATATATGAAGG
jgi:hypothetical protein